MAFFYACMGEFGDSGMHFADMHACMVELVMNSLRNDVMNHL